MNDESMQAELNKLRTEVEAFRQRELEDLRSQLATARRDAEHYRNEAFRLDQVGRQIHLDAQETIAKLRSQLEAKEQLMRFMNRGANAESARN